MVFSPRQNNVWDIQTTIRQIDMSLFLSLKTSLGTDQTFVYSTLAGCCAFIDSQNSNQFSSEIHEFASKIVSPIVEDCFEEIKKFNNDLNNPQLKLSLLKKLDGVQFYPERRDFKTIKNEELINELKKIIRIGTYTLYRVNPSAEKFYGGRIDISEEAFTQAANLIEKYGYKQSGDTVGSSFDLQGHITTIDPRELTQNYEAVVSAHNNFIVSSPEAALKPICIESGSPRSGRLSGALTISVEVDGLEKYRNILGAMKIPPHLTVFSKEIQVLPSLKNVTIFDFTKQEGSPKLIELNKYLYKFSIC